MAHKPHVQYRNLTQLLNADPGLATADFDVLSGVTASAAELNLTDALSTAGNATASKLLAEHKGNVGLLMPHIQAALRVEEADGQFQVVPANAASLEEVVTGLKSAFPAAFSDSGHTGGGAPGGGGGGTGRTMKVSDFNNLAPKEQAAFMAAKGALTE